LIKLKNKLLILNINKLNKKTKKIFKSKHKKENLYLVNDTKHIDTIGTYWYNSILFKPTTNKYYIYRFQRDTKKVFNLFICLISVDRFLGIKKIDKSQYWIFIFCL